MSDSTAEAPNPRFARMREIFHAACDLEGEVRERFLDEACPDDATLRAELHALFRLEDGQENAGLDAPLLGSSALDESRLFRQGLTPSAPRTIGDFRILRKLGEGSMGVVYCAEQSHPNRLVALKVVRDWLLAGPRQQRFHREASLLGRLAHPGIARIFEARVGDVRSDDGLIGRHPYLVMEFVDGPRITEYADQRRLSTRGRIELVAEICDAVHHAHCRGVVHRDLKPANILVDATGQPKVLDFGVSRAIDDSQQATLHTEAGQALGTIAYASPEQLRGDPDSADPQSDVYSLGVILFELLTGALPIDVRDLELTAALKKILEVDPAPAARFKPELRGDLSVILAKALEKSRERRYASVAELLADLRRTLRHEPIAARSASRLYLFQKFVRRHRTAVAGAAIAACGTVGGLSYGLFKARAERDAARAAEDRAVIASLAEKKAREDAQREARTAAAVNRFLNEDLLAAVGPDNTPNRDIRMREVLDNAARNIEGRFPDEPLVEAAIRATLGVTYLRLGEHEAATTHIRRAMALRHAHSAPTDPGFIEMVGFCGSIAYQHGRFEEAIGYLKEMLALAHAAFPGDDPMKVDALGSIGAILLRTKGPAEAEPYLRDAEEMLRRIDPRGAAMTSVLTNVANCHMDERRYDEAESCLLEAIEIGEETLGAESPPTLVAKGMLAALYNEQGQYACAAPILSQVLAIQQRILGPEHPQTLVTISNLGFSYLHMGSLGEAEALLVPNWQTRVRRFGEDHPNTLASFMLLGDLRRKQGRLDEAREIAELGLSMVEQSDAARARSDWLELLARIAEAGGNLDEAAAWRGARSDSLPPQ